MNKTLITLLVSGLLAANAQAAGQDNTWYGGAKLGWSNFYGVDESNSIAITASCSTPKALRGTPGTQARTWA